MKTQLNEIKRMQQLAGIINESQLNEVTLSPNEQTLVDAVVGDINEAIDLGKVLEKMTTNEIRALASLPPIDEPTQPIV
jgi:hypothetical protein